MKKLAKILTAAALCVAALTTFGCGDDKKKQQKLLPAMHLSKSQLLQVLMLKLWTMSKNLLKNKV